MGEEKGVGGTQIMNILPQALPKYIYLSAPLIFPTTSTELGQKPPGVNHSGRCSITLNGTEATFLEISLFGLIAVNMVVKVFHIWQSDPYMDMLRPSREST
jgi:hypothetical protein